jgi:hypothetical protein
VIKSAVPALQSSCFPTMCPGEVQVQVGLAILDTCELQLGATQCLPPSVISHWSTYHDLEVY